MTRPESSPGSSSGYPSARRHAFTAGDVEPRIGTGYPAPENACAMNRRKHRMGNHAGLRQFGVNVTVIAPGESSALRHWHKTEDEFVMVLDGEAVLITDDGEEVMTAGMCAGFPAGVENGHHLLNRSDKPLTIIEVGTRSTEGEEAFYPDNDLHVRMINGANVFTRKNGDPV